MTRLLRTLCLLLATGCPLLTHAQTSAKQDIPPPQAPFVAPVPDQAQWIITVKYGKEALNTGTSSTTTNAADKTPPPAQQIQQIRSTKVHDLKRDIFTCADGSTSELWYCEKMVFFPDSSGQKIMLLPIDAGTEKNGERGEALRSTGFPGVSWIKESYYKSPTKFQGELCYYYSLKPISTPQESGGDAVPVSQSAGAEAWISVKTNLPVAYRFDGILYIYAFDASTPGSLSLPQKYQAELDLYHRMIGR